ncbi:bifunctional 4-hydroxy-2-oxoglutarate aldolase/2-dehydro-3-deoxy-phosphogluconate aldolase [Gordonia sp. NB41Y]|uniref:bifunctional 4-hydroxy-2-oxoglutarate aldolase/2-dehydro-3-deoxy-phosphogluconate aldolase n=1 Tax=Gordonia sp. NB41Y TaxID=875808 RepID=UPI0002BD8095|nr:bifunctional 4-hydroxy-2-oxoglutarate aldolase/2-dehydro-3-deoxy-phosphogluconate aldolase [Gordonia sp. NB41Y]EMP13118.1 2-dehydro-3-deoxyphosphogluconate aldolase [Gordonia sp. NB41Y]WLP92861.1 bifunctional 4-hydroxy-2-oxoglutarate aldolase/2-dehydro-3-deoxy-phosphogluconate aldolase [Gordonia sp. NB41Y]
MSAPVIAVLRAQHADRYLPVIETLASGGITSVELTMSTPGTLESFAAIRSAVDPAVEIGVGTVTSVDQVATAAEVGADYLVTPVTDPAVIAAAVAADLPIYPGGLTPTELWQGWRAGARAVKVFPASTVGPGYISHLRGPFPDIEVVPSGGISIDDAAAWIEAGAYAVSLGGPLLGDALKGGSLDELAQRCRHLVRSLDRTAASR